MNPAPQSDPSRKKPSRERPPKCRLPSVVTRHGVTFWSPKKASELLPYPAKSIITAAKSGAIRMFQAGKGPILLRSDDIIALAEKAGIPVAS